MRFVLPLLLLFGCSHAATQLRPTVGTEPIPPAAEPPPASAVVETTPEVEPPPPAPPPLAPERLQLISRAEALLGRRNLKAVVRAQRLTDDCSGFTRLLYTELNVDLVARAQWRSSSAVEAIHDHAQKVNALHRETPKPGDLVFFRETYDRNRDRKKNDGLTHIGIVESVGEDETVVFIHRAHSGVRRSRLNLKDPSSRTDANGVEINDYVRAANRSTPGGLAGKLFAGYADAEVLIESSRSSPPAAPGSSR